MDTRRTIGREASVLVIKLPKYSPESDSVTLNGEPFEFVEEFTYLGSIISKDNGAPKDIRARRPKTTWRKTVMAKLQNMGLSWGEARVTAKHRTRWKNIVVVLCPTGH